MSLTTVDEMPAACSHGESTTRRCDICFSTNARQYEFRIGRPHARITTITPLSAGQSAVHTREIHVNALLQAISNLEAADYTLTFNDWITQVDWQFILAGSDLRTALFGEDKVNWAELWLDHTTPYQAYKAVA